MKIEHWAFLVSVLALIASIGIPIFQWKTSKIREASQARTLLLQKILAMKSVTYIAMHELTWLLAKHGSRMEPDQLNHMKSMVPRMRRQHDDCEKLHDAWKNYDDGETLESIESMSAQVDVMSSDASDTAKLIENGKRSYEEA